ncbi:MAG: hypothetical protein CVU65_13810 [Deltaproteobacteria bacterium HGW-Deltaproteobacteria-22]|jgi:hypothetical protein|nr:MAG: hypothetical protein CVU65_13810 [Deltaproteobacteria bacterium HGW-Deltaproteobacteria-22]
MSNAQILDDLLTSLGYPPVDALPNLNGFGVFVGSADLPYDGDLMMFEPLRRRGWCTHFDAEGQFFLPGEHSKLVAALLTLAGVHPLPMIRDSWLTKTGWVLELRDHARRTSYHRRDQDSDSPSDYCELWLVKALIDDWLAPEWLLLDPPTGDQTAFVCMMPKNVYDELLSWELINADPEGNFLQSADQLVLYPPRELERYLADVVKLSPEEAEEMVSERAGQWLEIESDLGHLSPAR